MYDVNDFKPQHSSTRSFNRQGFTSALGALAATLGSAVGLGNIWKFPALTGQNGGAAFLFIYLACVFMVGIPVMMAEFIIGRKAKANAVGAYKKLEPGRPWVAAGWMGVGSAFLIMAFYTDVAGWVFAYVYRSAAGQLNGLNAAATENTFNSLAGSVGTPLFWQWVVLLVVGLVVMAGVQKGIERITKILLPVLFVLLLLCDARALTLPGAKEGLNFLFNPDFSRLTGVAILTALGLAFFKLSVGMGTMTTYGSYMGDNDNLPATAIKVALSDIIVSLLAGIAVFPAVFAFGFEPEAGASLLFITIPMVFNSMPFGNVFMVLFFLLASIATIGAMISILEVPTAVFTEEYNWSRNRATIVSVLIMGLLGVLATLSTSVLADNLVWGKTWFDIFDFASSNVLMPLGGLIICLYVGWKMGLVQIHEEASNHGRLFNAGLVRLYTFVVKFIAPAAIIVILLNGLGFIKF